MFYDEIPEPKKPRYSSEQQREQGHQFAIVINFFVLVYNVIHKLAMPLYISWTSEIPEVANHDLDWWWLFHLLFYLALRRKRWDDGWLQLMIFMGFGGAALQIYTIMGDYKWSVVSYWVTALATAAVCTYTFTVAKYKIRWRLVLSGIFLGLFVQVLLLDPIGFYEKHAKKLSVSVKTPKRLVKTLEGNAVCGLNEFALPIQNAAIKLPYTRKTHELVVQSCGFVENVIILDREHKELYLQNQTGGYLNMKFNRLVDGQWKPIHNVPLPAHQSKRIPVAKFQDKMVLVFSDADPTKGLVLIFHDAEALTQHRLKEAVQAHKMIVDRFTVSFQ